MNFYPYFVNKYIGEDNHFGSTLHLADHDTKTLQHGLFTDRTQSNDMVKGFSASYTGEYNATAKPQFSVGECWDGSSTIKNWINGTKVNGEIQSAAFDFQFRYRVRDAVHQNNWRLLAGNASDGAGYPLILW